MYVAMCRIEPTGTYPKPAQTGDEKMKTTKCVECGKEIEYTEIMGEHIQLHGERVGCHDVMADDYCLECESTVFDTDDSYWETRR